MTNTAGNHSGRVSVLDGIRGWGALFVVLYHVYVQNFPPTGDVREALLHLLPFRGDSAVFAFFVVSGYALSVGFLRTGNSAVLARILVGRYFRLMVPVLLGCIIVYACSKGGILLTPERRDAAADFWAVVHFGLVGAFTWIPMHASVPIPQLWTMPYELLGSILTLALVWVLYRLRWRMVFYGIFAVAVGCWDVIFSAFVMGVFIADLHQRDAHEPVPAEISMVAGCCLVLAILAIGFIPHVVARPAVVVAAIVIVGATLFNRTASRAMGSAVSQFLGSISFPMYIIHGAVIHSLGAWLHSHAVTPAQVAIFDAVTVIACIAVGALFRWSDDAGMKTAHLVGRILLSARTRPQNSDAGLARR